MKHIIFVALASLLTISVFAQNSNGDSNKVRFEVILPDVETTTIESTVISGVFRNMVIYLREAGYLFAADDNTFNKLLDIKDKNSRFAFEEFSLHSVINGLYVLEAEKTSEDGVVFRLTHTNLQEESSPYYTKPYPLSIVKNEDVQKHAAYSLIKKCALANNQVLDDSLAVLNSRLIEIQDQEAANKAAAEEERRAKAEEERRAKEAKEKEEQRKYTLRSFLPPVNQFSSPTSSGTVNGVAIVAGYALSIGGFIWGTTSYNTNKRRYDNVSVGQPEAEKARAYYKGQMDICRGGQIASAILFAGTYIYGVANALANRDAYMGATKDTSMRIAPVAYDNGAGIALVYRF